MKSGRLKAIAVTGILAVLAVVAENVPFLRVSRIAFGLLQVFALPGYATVCALLPESEISLVERMLASLGASLAITTCVAVLLAAAPVGLSKNSATVALGIGTAAISAWAWKRTVSIDGEAVRHRTEKSWKG